MSLNVDLLRKVADAIESCPELYNQNVYGELDLDVEKHCGTACCVAGFIVSVGCSKSDLSNVLSTPYTASRMLGLNSAETFVLFKPNWPSKWVKRAGMIPENVYRSRINPTPKEAATVLRAMADDGYIWGIKEY